MTTIPTLTHAFVVQEGPDGDLRGGVEQRDLPELGADDVLIGTSYSSVNYKDALAFVPRGGVVRNYPIVPGIDVVGEVIASNSPDFTQGEVVVAHGYELGTGRDGGYAQHVVVPANWVTRLDRLDARDAATLGTAGFTAAMSVLAIVDGGIRPADGPVLVTGATGGVGSFSIDLLAGLGYRVIASSGKAEATEELLALGAAEVVGRLPEPGSETRPLGRATWAAAVDCVGGATLAHILSTTAYGGVVAASGLTGGAQFSTTVLPFILRGVRLLGMDSVQMPIEQRRRIWQRLESDLSPSHLERIRTEIGVNELQQTVTTVHAGGFTGRAVVRLDSGW